MPIDKYDLYRGWIDLEIPDLDDEGGKSKKKTNVLNETPMGAGLKDGSTLAFKFRKERSEDDDLDMDDGEWDVMVPSYDEDFNSQTKVKGG